MDLFKSEAGKHFRCPNCRTDFKDFGMDSQDVVVAGRFKSFIFGLPLPRGLVDFLLAGDAEPIQIVPLETEEYLEGPFSSYHEELKIVSKSKFHPDFNPLWAKLVESLHEDDGYMYKLDAISINGDDIHEFVDRVCGGSWPPRGVHVELKCLGCSYPLHYEFLCFRKTKSKCNERWFYVV